jgi:hypothetical protein
MSTIANFPQGGAAPSLVTQSLTLPATAISEATAAVATFDKPVLFGMAYFSYWLTGGGSMQAQFTLTISPPLITATTGNSIYGINITNPTTSYSITLSYKIDGNTIKVWCTAAQNWFPRPAAVAVRAIL